MERQELMENVVKILDRKKATDIKVIEITDLTVVADYFVIATGTSGTHIRSLADEVEVEIKKQGCEPRGLEGKATGWILIDYGAVIVHIFTPDQRELFNLEHLWIDGKEVDISKFITE